MKFFDKIKSWFEGTIDDVKEWWDKTGLTGVIYAGVALLAFFGLKVYWIASASAAIFFYINWNTIRKIYNKKRKK